MYFDFILVEGRGGDGERWDGIGLEGGKKEESLVGEGSMYSYVIITLTLMPPSWGCDREKKKG